MTKATRQGNLKSYSKEEIRYMGLIHGNMMQWRGRNVDKLTKAELIQALYDMSRLYEEALKKPPQTN